MTNANIFSAAHKSTRAFFKMKMNKKYDYVVMFSFFLKKAYASAKAKVAKVIKNVLTETGKAVLALVNVTISKRVIDNNFKKSTIEVTSKVEMWIPKSQLLDGIVSKWFLSENNYISITN